MILVADKNGLNTINFIGASQQRFLLTNTITPGVFTIAVVAYRNTSGAAYLSFFGNSGVPNTGSLILAGTYFMYIKGTNKYYYGGTAPSPGSYDVYVATSDNIGGCNVYLNNGSASTLTTSIPQAQGDWNCLGYGDSTWGNGRIAELCFFNRVLDSTERTNIDSYLQTKWGIS